MLTTLICRADWLRRFTPAPRLLCLLAVALLLSAAATSFAQLDDSCTVAVLNRTARVDADGFWRLANVPTNLGQVRARATCVRNGVTTVGVSDFFLVPRDGIVFAGNIHFTAVAPVPASMRLSAPRATLSGAGDSVQLAAVVTNPDGSTRDVTPTAQGTSYTTSNASVITLSSLGVATATGNGVAIISAVNEGSLGLISLTVGGPLDTDGDGIPDDYERAVGLNPNDPSDAAGDLDGDGLSNLREYQLGTDPRNPDTDGDGVRDGLEVQLGTDPLDPRSYDLARALRRVDVAPPTVVLRSNPLFGEATQQLVVTGTMLDSFTIGLTSAARGTTYQSSNLSVVNFGPQDGLLFAGAPGSATVTVSSNTFTVAVPVVVEQFTPSPVGVILIPGYANNVKVSGGFAFVAAGNAGLQVVDVRNPAQPAIIGSLALPGVAIDVRIRGSLAYVACGNAGLQIVRIDVPTSPVLVGGVATPGTAQDVWIDGGRAYVADGDAGLQIIDISSPQAPAIIGSLALGGNVAKGVSVSGSNAVVAVGGSVGNVDIVDVSTPSAPRLVGTATVPGDPKDVVTAGNLAYVAAYTGGMQIVDFSTPASPRTLGGTQNLFVPRDVIVRGTTAICAEQLFPNAVPFVDVTDPNNPIFRAVIDLSSLGDYAGTGIDADQQYVYITGELFVVTRDFGDTGQTALMIAQYSSITDTAGIAPTVRITAPAAGATLISGSQMTISLDATDDVAVDFATVSLNGQALANLRQPFSTTIGVPAPGPLTIDATAVDFGGNIGHATPVTVSVIPDPLTTVRGFVRTTTGAAASGANVTVASRTAATDAAGAYEITGLSTVNGDLVAAATVTIGGTLMTGVAGPVPPVRGGITLLDVTVAPLPVGTVSSVPLRAKANGIDVRGNVAAVALGVRGVQLFSGMKPKAASSSAGAAKLLPRAEGVIAQSVSEIQLVDVSNPVAPFATGRQMLPGFAADVRIIGTRAYVATEEGGVQVVDITDPNHPAALAPLANSSGAEALAVNGSLLFVAAGGGGLMIYDLSNPDSPQQLATVGFGRPVLRVAALGTLVAVSEQSVPGAYGGPGSSTTRLLDVSTPATPVQLGNVQVNGNVRALSLAAQQLYVAASDVRVFDVSSPGSPSPITSPLQGFSTFAMAVSGARLVAAGSDFSVDNIAAVVDLAVPSRVPGLQFPTQQFVGDGVALAAPFAFVTGNGGGAEKFFVLKYLSSSALTADQAPRHVRTQSHGSHR